MMLFVGSAARSHLLISPSHRTWPSLYRGRGQPVAYLVASDEGHGFRKEISLLTITAALARFLAEHFGEGKDVEWVWTSSQCIPVDTTSLHREGLIERGSSLNLSMATAPSPF